MLVIYDEFKTELLGVFLCFCFLGFFFEFSITPPVTSVKVAHFVIYFKRRPAPEQDSEGIQS